ncbi:MAG: MBL fold metallo-hydrolase [Candidatus Omnitrophica bacterium]|nr:MBL fold metallo-hydrolase [Candidatus Omnitrophota bacterium]
MTDNIHWLGHSAVYIEVKKKVIYFDPYKLKSGLPGADIILITHGHFDHCSKDDIGKIIKEETVVIGPCSIEKKLPYPVKVMTAGDKINIGDIAIEAVEAYNINKVFHPKAECYLGFIVTVDGIRIYHAGDTDIIPEMRKIKADIALLPIGGTYTMDPKEAAKAAGIIKPKIAIPIHWGSSADSYDDGNNFQKLCRVPVKILKKE